MCPYCAQKHQADKCSLKGKTTSNCTACARRMKAASPTTDLHTLFSTTPLILRHSPLDPTFPGRIALSVEKTQQATEKRRLQVEKQAEQSAEPAVNTEAGQPASEADRADSKENVEMVVAQ